ncbi:glycosyltransferase [Aliivibrio fischeri]|uniref:glycosyltransferase n=1 Tax=Aliivibrio fischeri TaxID=668 RepID=UPI003735481B
MSCVLLSSLSYEGNYGGVENSLRYLAKSYKNKSKNVIILSSSSTSEKFERVSVEDDITLVRFRRTFSVNNIVNIILFPLVIIDLIISLFIIKRNYVIEKSICRNQFVCFFVNLFFRRVNVYVAPGFSHRQSSKTNMTLNSPTLAIRQKVHMLFDFAALRLSASVYVFSENMKEQSEELVSIFSFRKNFTKVKITKPGVDKIVFYPVDLEERDKIRSKLELPSDKIVLLCVGRCVKAKGFDYALQLLVKNKSTHLIIVGDGPELETIKNHAKAIDISDQVTFAGACFNTAEYYQASDYFIMSSVYEPLGQTILEAISCGLPVIAFRNNVMTATYEIMGDMGVIYIDKPVDIDIHKVSLCLSNCNDIKYQDLKMQALARSYLFEWDYLADELLS